MTRKSTARPGRRSGRRRDSPRGLQDRVLWKWLHVMARMKNLGFFLIAALIPGLAVAGGSPDLACRLLRLESQPGDRKPTKLLWDVAQKAGTSGLWDVAENVPTCIIFEPKLIVGTHAESEAHQIIWDRIDRNRRVVFPNFKDPSTLESMSEPRISTTVGLEVSFRTRACLDGKPCASKSDALVSATYACAEEAEDRRDALMWCRHIPRPLAP